METGRPLKILVTLVCAHYIVWFMYLCLISIFSLENWYRPLPVSLSMLGMNILYLRSSSFCVKLALEADDIFIGR